MNSFDPDPAFDAAFDRLASEMQRKQSAIDCAHGVPINLRCGACEVVMTEFDPTGRNPHSPGAKLDAGKAPLLRGVIDYFPNALEAVAEVSGHGAEKYTWGGWRTVPEGVDRYGDALVRHLTKEAAEGSRDGDSGLLHAAHAAWNALARLELLLAETANG